MMPLGAKWEKETNTSQKNDRGVTNIAVREFHSAKKKKSIIHTVSARIYMA